jgi:hypothetical protein
VFVLDSGEGSSQAVRRRVTHFFVSVTVLLWLLMEPSLLWRGIYVGAIISEEEVRGESEKE